MKKSGDAINKNKYIFLIIIGILILIFSITGVLLANNFLNLKGRRFVNLLTKEQFMFEFIDTISDNYLDSNESSFLLTLKKTPYNQLKNFFNIDKNDLLKKDISFNLNTIKENENYESVIKTNIISDKIQNIELIKENNKIAISIPGLYEKYIVFESQKCEENLRKILNLSGDNNQDTLKMGEKILEKYLGVLADLIDKYIKKNEDVNVSINDKDYITKQYVLTLDKESSKHVLNSFWDKLNNDEKTIDYILKIINDINNINNEFNNKTNEKLQIEDIKNWLSDYKNNMNKTIDNLSSNEVLKICLYEHEEKNIKTDIEVLDARVKLVKDTVKQDKKDISNDIITYNNKEIAFKYVGEENNDAYTGKLNVSLSNNPLIARIDINKNNNSQAKVRKLDSLTTINLSEASDSELNNIRNQIKKNLKKESNQIGGIKDFEIKVPTKDADIVENSRSAYNRINPIMTRDEVIAIIGEPSRIESGEDGEYLYWNQGENIDLISVRVKGIKLYDVYNNVVQNEKYNNELSKQLGQNIDDLNTLMPEITTEMSKEDVVNKLGENYIEVYKSNIGHVSYKWYDKTGNNVEIKFDENGKVIAVK